MFYISWEENFEFYVMGIVLKFFNDFEEIM